LNLRLSLAVLPLLTGCGDGGLCSNRITQRAAAADGSAELVVYERDCGATTAFATHVDIVAPGETPEGPSSVFVATRGNWHPEWGGAEATARWTGPNSLLIIHDPLSELAESDGSLGDITISYQTAENTR
jgi:hypothetical protein